MHAEVRRQLVGFFFSPPYVGPGDQTQVIRLGGQCLFTGPPPTTFSLLLSPASLLSLLISPPHPTPNFWKLLEFRSWVSHKGPFVKDLGAHPLCYWRWYNLWVLGQAEGSPGVGVVLSEESSAPQLLPACISLCFLAG